ncbi:MAG: hypothetical protein QG608_954 [Actinomycetota bacterium]|nr:hypothetical protein [Actinomycetota bacterium]
MARTDPGQGPPGPTGRSPAGQGLTGRSLTGPQTGLAQAIGEQFSLQASMGGVRGLVESVLPVAVFSVVYAITKDLGPSAWGALGVSALLVLVRLISRQPVSQAVSGMFGVLVGVLVAFATGRPVDFFLMTILKNVGLLFFYLGSLVVGWPFVGVMLGFLLGEQTHWRQVPGRRRIYVLATWVWVAMCLIRLTVEIPLYLADNVEGLGAVSVPLGLPLYGTVLLLTWVIVRRVPVARPDGAQDPADAGAAQELAPAGPESGTGSTQELDELEELDATERVVDAAVREFDAAMQTLDTAAREPDAVVPGPDRGSSASPPGGPPRPA